MKRGHVIRGTRSRTALAALGLIVTLATTAAAEAPASGISWIERLRGQVRETTATLAGELDAFLSDREYEAGLNETRLALRIGVDIDSDGGRRAILEPRVRLSLPNTERMLFLDIFGFDRPPGDTTAASDSVLPGTFGESIDAIQLRLGTTYRGLDMAPTIGLRLDGATPRAFAGLRVGASRQLSSGLALSGSQRLLLDSGRGLQAITLLRADWQTDESSLVRAQFVLDWRRDEEGLRREPSIIYRRFLDSRTAISFENTLTLYTPASDETDRAETALRLRRRIGGDGIFAELRPWLTFDPEDAASRTYGLEMSFDIAF